MVISESARRPGKQQAPVSKKKNFLEAHLKDWNQTEWMDELTKKLIYTKSEYEDFTLAKVRSWDIKKEGLTLLPLDATNWSPIMY